MSKNKFLPPSDRIVQYPAQAERKKNGNVKELKSIIGKFSD